MISECVSLASCAGPEGGISGGIAAFRLAAVGCIARAFQRTMLSPSLECLLGLAHIHPQRHHHRVVPPFLECTLGLIAVQARQAAAVRADAVTNRVVKIPNPVIGRDIGEADETERGSSSTRPTPRT